MLAAQSKKKATRHARNASTSGFSTAFDFVLNPSGNVAPQEYEIEDNIDRILQEHYEWPAEMSPEQITHSTGYIRYHITDASKAHYFLTTLRDCYGRHVLGKPQNIAKDPGDNNDYATYMRVDPVGQKDPETTDPRCWKVV